MSTNLSRMIKNIKAAPDLILTNRVDEWLMKHPEGITPDPEFLHKVLYGTNNSDRSARFGASSRGSCYRAQVMAYLGAQQSRGVNPVLQNLFNDGTWRHIRWQMMGMQAGFFTDVEVKYTIPDLRVGVSMDALNAEEGWGFELKGTSNLGNIINNGIPTAHDLQIHTMMLASGLEVFVYVAEDKRSQDWKEIVVHRNEKTIQKVEHELRRLNDAVDQERLPNIMGECKSGTGPTVKACPYGHICLGFQWPGSSEEEGSTEEEGVVSIRRGPRKKPHHR